VERPYGWRLKVRNVVAMKLERGQELYSEYREGTLSPAMRLALEQHFQADPSARADYEDFSRATALLEAVTFDEVEVPHGFRANVMARVTAAHEAGTERQSWRDKVSAWFGQPRRRELSAGLAGLIVAAGVVASVMHPADKPKVPTANMFYNPFPTTALAATTIRGVSTDPTPTDGVVYHNFLLHLPQNVKSATVNAFVITSNDQVTNIAAREQDATPALAAPAKLSNDEQMKIPVGLLKQAPSGSTLALFVQWTPDDPNVPAGSQVVFAPVDPNGPGAAPQTPPANGSFLDSLQAIAAQYHVTVVVDSSSLPTTPAAAWSASDDVNQALSAVAGSEGLKVDKLDATTDKQDTDTYLVHAAL